MSKKPPFGEFSTPVSFFFLYLQNDHVRQISFVLICWVQSLLIFFVVFVLHLILEQKHTATNNGHLNQNAKSKYETTTQKYDQI